MSRIGRQPVVIPAGVAVTVTADNIVTVKGPKGELLRNMSTKVKIVVEGTEVHVSRDNDVPEVRALHGLTRALINNMVIGVTTGFSKTLELVGVGYRAQLQGKDLLMALGYSHPVVVNAVEGITFETPTTNKVIVRGISKEKVGAIAADIRTWRKPEPYKGKGIKYEGEVIRRKEGKTGKK
jgi:large subunit ribosomal protein L6